MIKLYLIIKYFYIFAHQVIIEVFWYFDLFNTQK